MSQSDYREARIVDKVLWLPADKVLSIATAIWIGASVAAAVFGFVALLASWAQNRANTILAAVDEERILELQNARQRTLLELERLRAVTQWRDLSPEQAKILADAVTGQPNQIEIQSIMNDPESMTYADQISAALESGGWTSEGVLISPLNPTTGIFVSPSPMVPSAILQAALKRSHIEFAVTGARPNAVGRLILTIASKPRPQLQE
jgi:hypothetical protein